MSAPLPMAQIQHRDIPDGQRHEPKGISTATAGQVYVANGSGGGSWQEREIRDIENQNAGRIYVTNGSDSGVWRPVMQGWGYYQHSGAAQAQSTTASKLLINGSGSLTNTSYLPREIRGTGNLWDTTNNKITPIRLGDAYTVRLDLPITARSAATELTVSLDIGGTSSPTIVILPIYLSVGKTAPFTISTTIPVVALSSTTVTNGIQFFLATDTGTLSITNPSITIYRIFDGAY